eukprot:NODE_304_length_10309_cov_0.478355.p8 type:complete len:198 gc:universal NODE_304_length_10309_cov_0.478355:2546-3139(+)
MKQKLKQVLDFWYKTEKREGAVSKELTKLWYYGGVEVDNEIRSKFGPLIDDVKSAVENDMQFLLSDSRIALAGIIVLDQFPRNIFRKTARAFSYDVNAQKLVKKGIESGLDLQLLQLEKQFFYMPLMHSEDVIHHELLIQKIKDMNVADDGFLKFELEHYEIVKKFGRYPYRNDVLNRQSTDDEIEYLSQNKSSFGQ